MTKCGACSSGRAVHWDAHGASGHLHYGRIELGVDVVHGRVDSLSLGHVSDHVHVSAERDRIHVRVEVHWVLVWVHAGGGGHLAGRGTRTRVGRGHHGYGVVGGMRMVGASGSGRGGTVGLHGGNVVRLALCAVKGLLAGLAVVLTWGALVAEAETAFVLRGGARCAIWGDRMAEAGSLLLSLEGDAILLGYLGVAMRVYGGLKRHTHWRILLLVRGGRDVLHLLDRHRDVLYLLHGSDVNADSGHCADGVEGSALLLL